MSADAIPKLLAMLAEQSGEQVSRNRLDFIARSLSAHPSERVVAGLEKLVRTSRRFPTLGEIEAAMGVAEPSDDDKAREIADRIWGAIERWGSTCWPQVQAYIGPIGVAVVNLQGGWVAVCHAADYDNVGQMKAQWRDSAAAIARKGASGVALEAPPDFAKLPEKAATAIDELGAKLSLGPRGRADD